MFVYLSKKIAVPNNIRLKCVAYNKAEGFIACGGEDGLLKVLRLDSQSGKDPSQRGLAAPSNLSMNQPLEGHKGRVTSLSWNERHQKLTSGDENGYIIVWILHKGTWFEEMINTRSKAVVKGMKWSMDGQKICIAYADGAVIVGSVDGNRIWGKDLKNLELTQLEWSPDGKLLLFGVSPSSEVHVYDREGTFMSKLPIVCLPNRSGTDQSLNVVSIEWYNGLHGFVSANCPTLAICYSNGRCQIMKSDSDMEAIPFDAGIEIVCAQWNCNGSLLAIAGSQRSSEKDVNVVQFFNPFGEHLRTLKVPGKELNFCSWDGGGVRLALAVDAFIYFANVRPDYKWCYFADSVAYAYTRPDRTEHVVTFWDLTTNQTYIKFVRNFSSITAGGDFCCVASQSDSNISVDFTLFPHQRDAVRDFPTGLEHSSNKSPTSCKKLCDTAEKIDPKHCQITYYAAIVVSDMKQFTLSLCNSIGTPLDMKYIEMTPHFTTMTSSHIVAASREAFYVWQFKNLKQLATIEISGKRRAGTEKLYHIDDIPSGAGGDLTDFNKAEAPTKDPICAICASEKYLLVGRESGVVNHYSLPEVKLLAKISLSSRPAILRLNSNSSRLAVVDVAGVLMLYNVWGPGGEGSPGELLQFEKKDVWDIRWAEDNSDMLALMEKTKLFIFRGTEAEEPVSSSGYICQFKDLQVKSVLLDEVMFDPDNASADNIINTEVKSLRDARHLLEKAGIDEAMKFIEENQHQRLWRILAEFSLEKLNLKVAEQSFVRAKDYAGIQFVKRLANLQSESMKLAEVAAYFGRFDEAEKMYLDMDRKDLAIGLRKKLGDWFRVAQLIKPASHRDTVDQPMEEACNAIGDYFADRQQWQMAVAHYEKGRNQGRLAKCYYMMEDYMGLKKMINQLPENHAVLPELAEMFVTVGMCQESVEAYLKCNKVQEAIDSCIALNNWSLAIEVAKDHNVKEIDSMLVKYAQLLLEKKKILNAVELYRNANHYLEAAKLLLDVADREAQKKSRPLRLKKLYVLAGLLVEQYHDLMKTTSRAKTKTRSTEATTALAGLLHEDKTALVDTKIIDNAWRSAEAYHFYILAQRQLYQGHADDAVKSALCLRNYEDILDPADIYCLLALASAATKAFGICSKAFVKLESLENLNEEQRKQYEELALDIFNKHSPKDNNIPKIECPTCEEAIPDTSHTCPSCDAKFPTCIATGRPIFANLFWMCQACKHRASEKAIAKRETCPLCHTRVATG